MKNVHILPTDKPSNFYSIDGKHKLANSTMAMDWYISSVGYKPHNIYIISDEEIKEGDWHLSFLRDKFEVINYLPNGGYRKECLGKEVCKIILTTDQDLIKEGVQAIDDEFLEWFVKNPSCESVEIVKEKVDLGDLGHYEIYYKYKIIIPEEEVLLQSSIDGEPIWGEPKQDRTCTNNCSVVCGECQIFKPKQETLEEAAERLTYHDTLSWENTLAMESFKLGAKWQQERSYSEDDMREAFEWGVAHVTFEEWIKKFKNK